MLNHVSERGSLFFETPSSQTICFSESWAGLQASLKASCQMSVLSQSFYSGVTNKSIGTIWMYSLCRKVYSSGSLSVIVSIIGLAQSNTREYPFPRNGTYA